MSGNESVVIMADSGRREIRPECEGQIDTVNSNEGNVSESPGSGENDVSIYSIRFLLVVTVLPFIMHLKIGFQD